MSGLEICLTSVFVVALTAVAIAGVGAYLIETAYEKKKNLASDFCKALGAALESMKPLTGREAQKERNAK